MCLVFFHIYKMWPNNTHKHDEANPDEKTRRKYRIQFFLRLFVFEKIERD